MALSRLWTMLRSVDVRLRILPGLRNDLSWGHQPQHVLRVRQVALRPQQHGLPDASSACGDLVSPAPDDEALLRGVPLIRKQTDHGYRSYVWHEPDYTAMARAVREAHDKCIEEIQADQLDLANRENELHEEKDQKIVALAARVAELAGLYADMVNQFALYFTKDGVEMVGTGGLSDLEAAFEHFGLPDPCKFSEFRAALAALGAEKE
jgi:hypothetical protein